MRIFAVSDIHSFFTPFKKALDDSGFSPDNKEHLLIVLGDLFDRGTESVELLNYINSIDNKILIKGNHESLLESCLERGYAIDHDFHNGTVNTICDLGEDAGISGISSVYRNAYNKLKPIYKSMVDYVETNNYIFTHSWIPVIEEDRLPTLNRSGEVLYYDSNWRNASIESWESARWLNPFDMEVDGFNQTGKIIVHGHWHNSHGWSRKIGGEEFSRSSRFDTCEHGNCIGLDACTVRTGFCNVLVVEDELV